MPPFWMAAVCQGPGCGLAAFRLCTVPAPQARQPPGRHDGERAHLPELLAAGVCSQAVFIQQATPAHTDRSDQTWPAVMIRPTYVHTAAPPREGHRRRLSLGTVSTCRHHPHLLPSFRPAWCRASLPCPLGFKVQLCQHNSTPHKACVKHATHTPLVGRNRNPLSTANTHTHPHKHT